MDGEMVLGYRNGSAESLDHVWLRLDPNLSHPSRQSLEILSVQDAAGRDLSWRYQPFKFGKMESAKAQVELALPGRLAPSGVVELRVKFRLSGVMVGKEMIMLQDDPFHSLDAWYPKAMTKHRSTWSSDDDRPSNYEVTVRLPQEYTIASTGKLAEEKSADSRHVLLLRAHAVRGFTIYARTDWKRHRKHAAGVDLNAYLPEKAEHVAEPTLNAAADAIAFYRKEYGEFPTRHLEIVCLGRLGDPPHGSSAACNVITIWLGGAFEEQYRWLVAHEVAHQYFGSLIGLPRKSLGWVPVGLGLMMDEHYLKDRGLDSSWGRRLMRDFYFRAERMGFDTTLAQSVEKPLLSPPPWSSGWNMSLTHGKAYAVCSLLKDLVGEKKFQAVVRKIIAERAGTLIDGPDLIEDCQAALGKPLDWFVADWVEGRGTFDYAISSVQPTDGGWQVEVSRAGTARFPIVVQLETAGGQKLRQRADWQKKTDRLVFKTSEKLKTVTIDPDTCYPDMEPSNNSWSPKPTPAEKKR
jgi:hypothetical protein